MPVFRHANILFCAFPSRASITGTSAMNAGVRTPIRQTRFIQLCNSSTPPGFGSTQQLGSQLRVACSGVKPDGKKGFGESFIPHHAP